MANEYEKNRVRIHNAWNTKASSKQNRLILPCERQNQKKKLLYKYTAHDWNNNMREDVEEREMEEKKKKTMIYLKVG